VDRHHLLRRTLRGDRRQVDEGADPSPGKPGNAIDQFLVIIDAVFSGWLRPVETGQAEWG
jgi:hypothetical protein